MTQWKPKKGIQDEQTSLAYKTGYKADSQPAKQVEKFSRFPHLFATDA